MWRCLKSFWVVTPGDVRSGILRREAEMLLCILQCTGWSQKNHPMCKRSRALSLGNPVLRKERGSEKGSEAVRKAQIPQNTKATFSISFLHISTSPPVKWWQPCLSLENISQRLRIKVCKADATVTVWIVEEMNRKMPAHGRYNQGGNKNG